MWAPCPGLGAGVGIEPTYYGVYAAALTFELSDHGEGKHRTPDTETNSMDDAPMPRGIEPRSSLPCSGTRIRTGDLWIMSPTRCRLRHPAKCLP
jgi:hypothetical protein